MTTGQAREQIGETKQLTSGRGEHTHERRELGWTPTMGNMQSSAGWAWDSALRRWMLRIVHCGRARQVRRCV
jgi:hypothetical protein